MTRVRDSYNVIVDEYLSYENQIKKRDLFQFKQRISIVFLHIFLRQQRFNFQIIVQTR